MKILLFLLTAACVDAQMLSEIVAGMAPPGGTGGGSCTPTSGFLHCRPLTINSSQVGGATLSNFAVLTGNASGPLTLGAPRIQNSNCYDVVFTSDSAGALMIPWEMESCAPSTGAVIAWVQLASVSASANTTFYVSYDNPSISAAQNIGANAPSNVWDSNYVLVQHLPNGTTLTSSDSTSIANNCTNHNATATTGRIDGAAALNGSSAYLECGNVTGLASMTFSVWINSTFTSSASRALTEGYYGGDDSNTGMIMQMQTNGNVMFGLGYHPFSTTVSSGTSIADGNWHYVVGEVTSGAASLYIDAGTPVAAGASSLTLTSSNNFEISGYNNGSGDMFSGSLDEVRASKIARPANWITAEYNNQWAGSTFLTVGGEI